MSVGIRNVAGKDYVDLRENNNSTLILAANYSNPEHEDLIVSFVKDIREYCYTKKIMMGIMDLNDTKVEKYMDRTIIADF